MRLRRVLLALAATVGLLALAGPAGAIVGGAPDTSHPYVGLLDDGSEGCSGTLISSRVVATAAHCFSGSSSLWGVDDGQPKIRVTFDRQGIFNENRVSYFGAFYWDPAFCSPCGQGAQRFDSHDVAIVVLDSDVPMETYGQLPSRGLDDTLGRRAPLDVVGYGVQAFIGRDPDPNAVFTRFAAGVQLLEVDRGRNNEFLKVTSAQCFGDSGGPVLLSGTNRMVAIVSYGKGSTCRGNGFDYRLDGSALDWIAAARRAAHV